MFAESSTLKTLDAMQCLNLNDWPALIHAVNSILAIISNDDIFIILPPTQTLVSYAIS